MRGEKDNKNGKFFLRVRSIFAQMAKPYLWFFYYKIYVPFLCYYYNFADVLYVKRAGFQKLAPPALRYRVNGTPNVKTFLYQGRVRANCIEDCLRRVGLDLGSGKNVLDFACGCGRTIIWLADKKASFYGTDTDSDTIRWCQENLKFANFSVNNPLPPLGHENNKFDLIYAMSVFTHFNEYYQFQWLAEFKRILRPNGILILTLYDENEKLEEIEELKFRRKNDKLGKVPIWYMTSARSKRYVFDNYSKYFDIVDYANKVVDNETLVVLRKS
jgi:SAM-dependent methyltransferase